MQAVRHIDQTTYEVWDDHYRVAIIKRVTIGQPPTLYWRSVTGDQNPDKRTLIGFFPTLQFAATVTWRLWDQHGRIPIEKQYV